jgi:hypothetical protein
VLPVGKLEVLQIIGFGRKQRDPTYTYMTSKIMRLIHRNHTRKPDFKDSVLVEYVSESLSDRITTFRRNIMPSY